MTALAHVDTPVEQPLPPHRIYSTFYDNDVKRVQELCIVTADTNCQSGVAAHLDLNTFLKDFRSNMMEIEDSFDLIRKYAAGNCGKGFFVWSDVDKEVQEIRDFIGKSRVVTGFRYDGLLPDIFQKYGIDGLNKKIFSVKDWLETYLEKPMTLSQTIKYFGFWIDLDEEGGSLKSSPNHEKKILLDHKEDLFLSIYLVIVAHLIVNDKLTSF